MYPTIEGYVRILGVLYDMDFTVSPSLNTGFKLKTSKFLTIKKSILGKESRPDKQNVYIKSLMYPSAGRDACEKSKTTFLVLGMSGIRMVL